MNIEQFDLITQKNTELEKELAFENCHVLGFLGSFYGYEGIDLTIAAMPAVLAKNPNVRLLLVGGGPQEKNLKQQVTLLGLEGKVIFTGRVPHSEVGKYYSLVDLLVYPRKNMRLTDLVTPLKPLEAMAQGKLVLASDVGGHKELITDNENGFLFKADNVEHLSERIIELLARVSSSKSLVEDPISCVINPQTIIKNGRDYVENVRNWKTSVSNYLPLYQQLLKGAYKNR